MALEIASIPFVEARWYTPTDGRDIDWMVQHTMQALEKVNTAEAVASYFASTDRKSSAHYNIDSNSIVQSVRDRDVAYAAPGGNHNGLHFEHAGYAEQVPEEWEDEYSISMLELSAELQAIKVVQYDIPLRWLNPTDLQAGRRGFTTHNNLSVAFYPGGHWDPGPHFPFDWFLERVIFYVDNPSGEPPAPENRLPEEALMPAFPGQHSADSLSHFFHIYEGRDRQRDLYPHVKNEADKDNRVRVWVTLDNGIEVGNTEITLKPFRKEGSAVEIDRGWLETLLEGKGGWLTVRSDHPTAASVEYEV